MTHQQGIVKGDVLQRIGSAGFIIGAVLIVTGNILLPRAVDARSVREMVTAMGEQQFLTRLSALLITIGIWAVMIGAAGVYRSLAAGGGAWARLGFYFVVVGTALWTVNLALDMASANAVAGWLAASGSGKEAAYYVVAALSAFGLGIFSMNIIIYWLAFAFLGIGMVGSAVYPRWLGWVGVILGMTLAPIGFIQIVTGRLNILNLIFMVFSLLAALWILAVGIWVARKAWQPTL
jgi:hypothetical protein